ncbi:MAG: sigma-70 family RNA polymerase sigma factor [Bacillota bacterium]|nr:sigma-70 family RNA polymerase sigma factor [Bacillota bacterium]
MNDIFPLIEKAQSGDQEACAKIIEKNAALIWSIVRRFLGRGVDADDLYQLGSMGCYKAILCFDPSFNTQFSTYAVPKIAGEIKRFLRDDGIIKINRITKNNLQKIKSAKNKLENTLGREPRLSEIAQETGLDIEEIAVCENAGAADSLQRDVSGDGMTLEDILFDDTHEEITLERYALNSAVRNLPERERKVIYLRFYKGLTQQKTAEVLKISQVQVSRVERKALGILKTKIS